MGSSRSEDYYLHIAGSYIQVCFYPSGWDKARKYFVSKFILAYKRFIVNKKMVPFINYTLDIQDTLEYKGLQRKTDKRLYIMLYEVCSPKRLTTYYYISPTQFRIVLNTAIQIVLKKRQGFLIHSSSSEINGEAVLFIGPSGAGKTTIVNLLQKKYMALTEDSSYICIENNHYYLYMTPLPEKISIKKRSNKYPISKIYFLYKSNHTGIEELKSSDDIYINIMKQLWTDTENASHQIKYVADFIKRCRFYNLFFQKDANKLLKLFENIPKK